MKTLNIYLLVLLLFITTISTAEESVSKKIIVYGYTNYMPFMDGEGNNAKGLYSILVKEIFKKAGYEVEFKIQPWKRALRDGLLGKGILAGIVMNKERSAIMDFSNNFYKESNAVYVLKSKKFNYQNINDLKDKKIGIRRSFSYGEEFDQAKKEGLFSVQEAKLTKHNFQKLLSGRLDCLIDDEIVATSYLNKENLSDKIIKLDNYVIQEGIYIAVSKKLNKQKLLDEFNHALIEMNRDGSYQIIVNNYSKNEW